MLRFFKSSKNMEVSDELELFEDIRNQKILEDELSPL